MARQAGVFIEGTIDDLTYYRMDGKYYVRMKSSLTGKKFWKGKAFEGSRRSCQRFAEGNRIASSAYRKIDEKKRVYKLFCFLKTRAILLIKEGRSVTEAEEVLLNYLLDFGFVDGVDTSVGSEKKNCTVTRSAVENELREDFVFPTSTHPGTPPKGGFGLQGYQVGSAARKKRASIQNLYYGSVAPVNPGKDEKRCRVYAALARSLLRRRKSWSLFV